MKPKMFTELTGLKGFAGLWVVLFHVIGTLGIVKNIGVPDWFYYAIGPIATSGWFAVDIFFVLSAFFISYRYIDFDITINKWLTKRYSTFFPNILIGVMPNFFLVFVWPEMSILTFLTILAATAVLVNFATNHLTNHQNKLFITILILQIVWIVLNMIDMSAGLSSNPLFHKLNSLLINVLVIQPFSYHGVSLVFWTLFPLLIFFFIFIFLLKPASHWWRSLSPRRVVALNILIITILVIISITTHESYFNLRMNQFFRHYSFILGYQLALYWDSCIRIYKKWKKYLLMSMVLTIYSLMFMIYVGITSTEFIFTSIISAWVGALLVLHITQDDNSRRFFNTKMLRFVGSHAYGIFLFQSPTLHFARKFVTVNNINPYYLLVIVPLLTVFISWFARTLFDTSMITNAIKSVLTQIISVLKSKLIVLIYCSLFLLLVFLFDSDYLVPDSNLLINIDQVGALKTFTHSWDSTVAFGLSMNWPAAYLFPYLISQVVLVTIFGHRLGQSIFFSLPFVIGTAGMHYLVRVLLGEVINKPKEQINRHLLDISYFFASLSYVSNIYFILVYVGAVSMTFTHIALPFQIGLLVRIIGKERPKITLYFQFAIATLIMSGTSPPYIFISLIALICILGIRIVELAIKKNHEKTQEAGVHEILRRLIILALVTLLINAIWILPVSTHFLTLNGGDGAAALSENPSMHNRQTSYLNVFRNMGLWAFGSGNQGKDYYQYSKYYLENSVIQYVFYATSALFILSLISTRSRRLFVVLIAYLVFFPLVVGTNQGMFTGIYQWIYDYVPGFTVFRGSYKFVGILIAAQSVGLSYLAFSLRKNRLILLVFLIVLIPVVIGSGYPIWSRNLFEESKKVKEIPNYYYEAADFFNKDSENYRIWLLPDQYVAFYEWGKIGANVEVIWHKPLITRLATSPVHIMNIANNNLIQNLKNGNNTMLEKLYGEYNIKYIVLRDDVVWNFYPQLSIERSVILKTLSKYPSVQIGKLKIYRNTHFIDKRISGNAVNSFKQLSPTLYTINIQCDRLNDRSELIFQEKNDEGWRLYMADKNSQAPKDWISLQLTYIKYIAKKPLQLTKVEPIQKPINQWSINRAQLNCSDQSQQYNLYYWPQNSLSLGIILSITSLVGLSGFCLVTIFKRRSIS